MPTLDLPTLKSIRRLLRAGVRHAEIARRFDLAVGTISRVASERKLRRRKLHLLTDADLPEDDQPPEYLAANLRRCQGCGGMVYQWPCLACRLRAALEAGLALADGEPADHLAAASGRAALTDRETERRRDRATGDSVPPSSRLSVSPSIVPTRFTMRSHAHAHA